MEAKDAFAILDLNQSIETRPGVHPWFERLSDAEKLADLGQRIYDISGPHNPVDGTQKVGDMRVFTSIIVGEGGREITLELSARYSRTGPGNEISGLPKLDSTSAYEVAVVWRDCKGVAFKTESVTESFIKNNNSAVVRERFSRIDESVCAGFTTYLGMAELGETS